MKRREDSGLGDSLGRKIEVELAQPRLGQPEKVAMRNGQVQLVSFPLRKLT